MLLKIWWQDGAVSYLEAISVETHKNQEEIVVWTNNEDTETYDITVGAFYVSTPQGWEEIK